MRVQAERVKEHHGIMHRQSKFVLYDHCVVSSTSVMHLCAHVETCICYGVFHSLFDREMSFYFSFVRNKSQSFQTLGGGK